MVKQVKQHPALPRFSIASLLVLMIFAAFGSMAYRFLGGAAIFQMIIFAPTVLGACVGVMEWSHSSQPQRLLRIVLYTCAVIYFLFCVAIEALSFWDYGVSVQGFGLAMIFIMPFVAMLWFLQYTSVASMYD